MLLRGVNVNALADQLTRAYVRAAPGRIDRASYDEATGAFAASGTAPAPGIELLAFYPAAKHGAPGLEASGLRDVRAEPAPGGGLFVIARSAGGDWSLRATPR